MPQPSRREHRPPLLPAVQVSGCLRDFADVWPRTGLATAARAYAFQYADILEVWCDTIGRARGVEPCFVAVLNAAGAPELLLPLGIERKNGVRILRFLDGGVSDYNAPAVCPDAADWSEADARLAWEAVRRSLPAFDIAILDKMPERVEELRNPLAPLATQIHPDSCHVATLSGPWAEFAKKRIPHLADSRRCRRKLDKLGQVRIAVAATDAERMAFLEAMMRMKRRRYIETRGHDMFAKSGYGDFYRETTRRLGAGGTVQLAALTLDGEILAAHWGYATAERFYYLMPSHEGGRWRSFAPGRLLNEWLLEWSVSRGLKWLDFGIGDEPYKMDYCDVHMPLRNADLPATLRGRLFGAAMRLQSASRGNLRNTRLGTALVAARRRWNREAAGAPSTVPSR